MIAAGSRSYAVVAESRDGVDLRTFPFIPHPARRYNAPMNHRKPTPWILACLLTLLAASCSLAPPSPGIGEAIEWHDLPGWTQDTHAKAWPALLQQCVKMPKRNPDWKTICDEAYALGSSIDDNTARRFFETHFVPHRFHGSGDQGKGLVTGYYEPVLNGSLTKTGQYRHPVHARPDDLIRVDLAGLYPELEGKRLRGRLVGNTLVPYYTRDEITGGKAPLDDKVLLWVDDPVALFFLHIQGSGRVRLPDGRLIGIGYADQNGQPYTSIGKVLIEQGEIAEEDISLFTIRDWLRGHPNDAERLLNRNRSYVFFQLRESAPVNPVGSLNVPLTPARSIAVDPKSIALGTPVWIDTSWPDGRDTPLRRLMLAQDTGGAIKGHARADIFWGSGPRAEKLAGEMKQEGTFYVLLPKETLKSPAGWRTE